AESVVAEDEATEVAGERLDAETRRDEVVIGAEVAEVVFDEQLLEAHLTVQTRRALPDVDVHHAGVPGAEIVDVEDRRHAQLPVGEPEPAPVGKRHEVGARLRRDRPDRARPGFTEALFSGRRRLLHLQCIAIRDAAVRGQERYGEEYTFLQDEQSPTPSLAHT